MTRYLRITFVALSAFACALTHAQSQTLYKQVDKDGNVTYTNQPSDKESKDIRLEFDKELNVTKSIPGSKAGSALDTRVKQREALRDKLRANVEQARAKLLAAQVALVQGKDPRDDEWQPTVSNLDNSGKPNAKGKITGRGGKVECSKVTNPDGTQRIFCPAVSVPNEGYSNRVNDLEEAVAAAERELRVAEQFYRRNAPD